MPTQRTRITGRIVLDGKVHQQRTFFSEGDAYRWFWKRAEDLVTHLGDDGSIVLSDGDGELVRFDSEMVTGRDEEALETAVRLQ